MTNQKIRHLNHSKTIKFGLFLFFAINTCCVVGQDLAADYQKAKDYLEEGNYAFAIELFGNLSRSSSPYTVYASFNYAIAAYKSGDLGQARSMWLQIEKKYPTWDKISDVYYWLAKVYFLEGAVDKGMTYARKSKLREATHLMYNELAKLDSLEQLKTIYREQVDDQSIALILAGKMAQQPVELRDFATLAEIVDKYNLDKESYGLPDVGESELKDEYLVAVMMPFFFDSLENPIRTVRNAPIMGLYNGILEAIEDLNATSGRIKIIPYDTRRDPDVTREILSLPEFKSMDLIIGPLFPEPLNEAMKFSFENKINLINPLSTDSEVIGYNPYAFLFRPTTETQAQAAADIVADSVENKYAMLFYEDNAKDSLSAAIYAQSIKARGFEVLLNLPVRDTTVKAAYELLTNKYEIVYTKGQVDSLLVLDETRVFKERKSTEHKDVIEYYEEFFVIEPDSIGHIYVASSKPLFASTFISAIEVRDDSTLIVGRGNWKEFETLTFEEIERLGIYLVDPDHMDITSDAYLRFRERFIRKYKELPSFYHALGYEVMHFTGSLMKSHGHYFQNSIAQEGIVRGQLFYGLDFRFSNSNRFVPITKFVNSMPQVLNRLENEVNQ